MNILNKMLDYMDMSLSYLRACTLLEHQEGKNDDVALACTPLAGSCENLSSIDIVGCYHSFYTNEFVHPPHVCQTNPCHRGLGQLWGSVCSINSM
jgi:hypothetical protein